MCFLCFFRILHSEETKEQLCFGHAVGVVSTIGVVIIITCCSAPRCTCDCCESLSVFCMSSLRRGVMGDGDSCESRTPSKLTSTPMKHQDSSHLAIFLGYLTDF